MACWVVSSRTPPTERVSCLIGPCCAKLMRPLHSQRPSAPFSTPSTPILSPSSRCVPFRRCFLEGGGGADCERADDHGVGGWRRTLWRGGTNGGSLVFSVVIRALESRARERGGAGAGRESFERRSCRSFERACSLRLRHPTFCAAASRPFLAASGRVDLRIGCQRFMSCAGTVARSPVSHSVLARPADVQLPSITHRTLRSSYAMSRSHELSPPSPPQSPSHTPRTSICHQKAISSLLPRKRERT